MKTVAAMTFDVFGTVVDWRGSIAAEGRRVAGRLTGVDWEGVAASWSAAYGSSLASMTDWTNLDVMLQRACGPLTAHLGLTDAELAEFSTAWSRLKPWPDAVVGFGMLRGHYDLAALTNANHDMLKGLAAHGGLPWDALLSAETARRYKPDPEVYLTALRALGLPARRVMMVASHTFDLNAAHALGMQTALICRVDEPGSDPGGLDHAPEVVEYDLEAFAGRMLTR